MTKEPHNFDNATSIAVFMGFIDFCHLTISFNLLFYHYPTVDVRVLNSSPHQLIHILDSPSLI